MKHCFFGVPDNGTMPLPPHPSLHLSVRLSDGDGDGLRRAAEEGDEEDELIVLDPEHVKQFSRLTSLLTLFEIP